MKQFSFRTNVEGVVFAESAAEATELLVRFAENATDAWEAGPEELGRLDDVTQEVERVTELPSRDAASLWQPNDFLLASVLDVAEREGGEFSQAFWYVSGEAYDRDNELRPGEWQAAVKLAHHGFLETFESSEGEITWRLTAKGRLWVRSKTGVGALTPEAWAEALRRAGI